MNFSYLKQDFDSGTIIEKPDTPSKFYLVDTSTQVQPEERERSLASLVAAWEGFEQRIDKDDQEWIDELSKFLDGLANERVEHVREWLQVNTIRFNNDAPQFEDARRLYDSLIISLRANIRICGLQCGKCQLHCLHAKHHDGDHNCQTNHQCKRLCQHIDDTVHDDQEPCGLP